jgi:uncharacterized membrane protein YkoI
MKAPALLAFAVTAGLVAGADAEKRIAKKDLPAAVRTAVDAETKGSQVKGYASEVENGQTFYEAETVVNGRTRDLLYDAQGKLVEVEEEVSLDSIPAAAKAAIQKQAAGGKILKVEKVTKGDKVKYEAAVRRGTKRSEIAVTADGSPAQ